MTGGCSRVVLWSPIIRGNKANKRLARRIQCGMSCGLETDRKGKSVTICEL